MNNESTKLLQEQFIEAFPLYGTVGATLKAIGVKSRTTFYGWLKRNKRFARVYYEELQPNCTDLLESALYQAALGNKKLGPGQVTAAKYLLTVKDPERYAEKQLLEHTGSAEKPVRIFLTEVAGRGNKSTAETEVAERGDKSTAETEVKKRGAGTKTEAKR
jgi:hypothetical protein